MNYVACFGPTGQCQITAPCADACVLRVRPAPGSSPAAILAPPTAQQGIIAIDQQIAEVQREIGMRMRVYPRWIEANTMTHQKAERQIAAMLAVQTTLEQLRDERVAKVAPGLFP